MSLTEQMSPGVVKNFHVVYLISSTNYQSCLRALTDLCINHTCESCSENIF